MPKRAGAAPKRAKSVRPAKPSIKPVGGADAAKPPPPGKKGSKGGKGKKGGPVGGGGAGESKDGSGGGGKGDDEEGGGSKGKKKRARRTAGRGGKGRRKKGLMYKLKKKLCPGAEAAELGKRAQEIVDATMLTNREVNVLKAKFDLVDIDGEGEMDFDEFFELVGEDRTPFTDAVFTLLDDPNSKVIVLDPEVERARAEDTGQPPRRVAGALTFDDWVQISCVYCMYTREDILMFAFQAFDRDGSGVIDEDEFIELCATVNNMNPTYPGNFKRAMEEFDKNDDGMIDFEEFCALNRRYPLVLFPAFRLQDRLQRESLGEDTWVEINARNQFERDIDKYRRAHNGKFPPIESSEKFGRMFCPCFMPPDVHKLIKRKSNAMATNPPPSAKPGMLADPTQNKGKKKKKAAKAGGSKKYYTG